MNKETEELIKELIEKREIIIYDKHFVIGTKAENILAFSKEVKIGFEVKHYKELSEYAKECVISYKDSDETEMIKYRIKIKQGTKSKIIKGECCSEGEFGEMILKSTRGWDRSERKTITIDFIDTMIKLRKVTMVEVDFYTGETIETTEIDLTDKN
ncbi:MAG: hypothetical protein FWE36_00260 [Erysipelotrichales bacterium]|nr:hypothetical protein [Erysipelotrichales bacterium]